jgi:hypothetical protein
VCVSIAARDPNIISSPILTSVGPSRGPKRYHPNTPALWLGSNISLIVPPPFAIPTDPKNPLSVRTAIKVSIFGASALGICSTANTVKHTRYSLRRPNVSDKGARNSGPSPSMITKPVVQPMTTLGELSSESAICWMPGVNILDARGERMLMAAMMATLAILVRCGHWRGFSGSVSSKLRISRVSFASPSSRWMSGSLSAFCIGLF